MHRDLIEPRINSDLGVINPSGGSIGGSSLERILGKLSGDAGNMKTLINSLLRRIEKLEGKKDVSIRRKEGIEYNLKNGYIPYYNGANLADSPMLNDRWDILVYKNLKVKGDFKAQYFLGPILVKGSIMVDDGNTYGWAGNREYITGSRTDHYIRFYVDAQLRMEINSDGNMVFHHVVDANADTDKFLVLDGSNLLKYRTGDEVQSDLGINTEVELDYDDPVEIDASEGDVFHLILEGDPDISAPTNPIAGRKMVLRLQQDGTGGRTVTWDEAFRFSTDLPEPTLSSDPDVTDYYGFIYNGIDEKWDLVGQVQGF